MNRTILIVDGGKFTILLPMGAFESKYTAKQQGSRNEIDINRFDGASQLGVFDVSESQLLMNLSKPDGSRPALTDFRLRDGSQHWHTKFRRRPTQEGLEVLTKHIDKIPSSK